MASGCIIAYRVNGGPVQVVSGVDWIDDTGTDYVYVFPNRDAALGYADKSALFQSGQADYQLIELTEL